MSSFTINMKVHTVLVYFTFTYISSQQSVWSHDSVQSLGMSDVTGATCESFYTSPLMTNMKLEFIFPHALPLSFFSPEQCPPFGLFMFRIKCLLATITSSFWSYKGIHLYLFFLRSVTVCVINTKKVEHLILFEWTFFKACFHLRSKICLEQTHARLEDQSL